MKSLHGVLHGRLRIRFYGLSEFLSSPPPRGDLDANFGGPLLFILNTFPNMTYFHDILHGIFQNRFQQRFQNIQTSLNSSLKLVGFETYYIEPNPSLFFHQHNMQESHNMVHSHFTLCLRALDYIKRLSQHPWYGLWMRVKGPHHYKVTALGSGVKWP